MVVQRLSNAVARARRHLREHPPLCRLMADLGIGGFARDLILTAHVRGEPIPLSELIVASGVPRQLAGCCIRQLVEGGHLVIADGRMAVARATAEAIDRGFGEAGITGE